LTKPTVVQAIPGIATTWQATALNPTAAGLITRIAQSKSSSARWKLVEQLRAHAEQSGHRGGW
jgi:hypothetical protein